MSVCLVRLSGQNCKSFNYYTSQECNGLLSDYVALCVYISVCCVCAVCVCCVCVLCVCAVCVLYVCAVCVLCVCAVCVLCVCCTCAVCSCIYLTHVPIKYLECDIASRSFFHCPYTVSCKKECIIALDYELFMIGKRLLFLISKRTVPGCIPA